ncbi:MAG: integration host factor subunit beta [Planctomycetes bacterium]|nr:integration host factor subunit beta [Planctomycetota bacterium]
MSQPTASTITKKEIVNLIAEKTGLTAVDTMNVVQTFMDIVIDELATGKRFEFREFGVFETKRRKARVARNPKTGDKVEVAPRTVVTFKPGLVMKRRVMDGIAARFGGDGTGAGRSATPATPPPNPWG